MEVPFRARLPQACGPSWRRYIDMILLLVFLPLYYLHITAFASDFGDENDEIINEKQ